jgi:hypothetical protein
MRNDGQIFGVDEEVLQAARDRKAPVFRIHRLVPCPAKVGFKPEFKGRIYSLEEIDWGTPGTGRRPRSKIKSYDELVEWRCQEDSFIRKMRTAFFQALADQDRDEAGRIWDVVRGYVGGMHWKDIPSAPYDSTIALGVLATLSTGRLCLQTRIDVKAEAHLVNSMLLEPNRRRVFSELFEQLAEATTRRDLLSRPKVCEKLERAKAETMSFGLARRIGPVYNAFISQGAFRRLLLSDES